MVDIVDKATRSKMMSNIKSKNTKPEILIRKLLHRQGFRFKLHDKTLPGKPDLVLPKYRAVININGCFWHCHSCHLFKWPDTKKEFWRKKITSNAERDSSNTEILLNGGWRVLVVWECSIKGKYKIPPEEVVDRIVDWLVGGADEGKIECQSEGLVG